VWSVREAASEPHKRFPPASWLQIRKQRQSQRGKSYEKTERERQNSRGEKITMMPVLNANVTTQAKAMTGAQRAGVILALAFFLMVGSSACAQVTILYNFGTHTGDPTHPQ
jgi:hypothetical protein